jgi:outer membrane protein assembly factor BamB
MREAGAMIASSRRRGGRVLLIVCAVLFGLFAGLVVYQKHYADRERLRTDPDLGAELAIAALIEEGPPPEGDWPQWRGPRRDGVAHCPDLRTTWSGRGPARLWRADGGEGFSSVAVAAGRACTLLHQDGREVVVCWQVRDGKELWRFAYDAPSHRDYPGPRSTPTIDGGRVYTVGTAGLLHCLDAAEGKVIWKKDLRAECNAPGGQWGQAFSPLIEGDLLLTAPGGPGAALAAFDKTTGDLRWKNLDDPPGYSSPVPFTAGGVRQIVAFTGNSIVGVSPVDGTLYWRPPWGTKYEVNAATPLTFHARSGDRTLDYVFISSGYGQGCALLKIEAENGRFRARPVYEGNQLCCHFASPVRCRDRIYGFNESTLVCMDLRTGAVRWKKSGYHKGTLLLVDHYLLVLGETGQLALLEASAQEPEPIAHARPLTRRCWTMPVLAEGRLFLRDEEQVLCLDVSSKE